MYYTTPAKKSEGVKGFWCHSCFSEHRGEVIELEGMRVRKVRVAAVLGCTCRPALLHRGIDCAWHAPHVAVRSVVRLMALWDSSLA